MSLEEENEKLKKTISFIQKLRMREKVEMFDFFYSKLGNQFKDILDEYIIKDATNEWKEIAKNYENCDIRALIKALWEDMCGQNEFEFTWSEEEGIYQMNVTFCPLVRDLKEINGTEWGYHMFCMSDHGIVQGFNPKIEFTRSKTLMQGDDCCDHCYKLKN